MATGNQGATPANSLIRCTLTSEGIVTDSDDQNCPFGQLSLAWLPLQELLTSGQVKQSEAAAAAEAARSRAELLQEQLRMEEAELHQLRLSSTRDAASLEEANRQRLDATAKLKASEIVRCSSYQCQT